jgi:type IV secretion system protein VirB2
MKPSLHMPNTLFQPKQVFTLMLVSLIVVCAMTLPGTVLAQDLGGTDTKVCGFFSNINSLLNMASIAVVTIAVVFAGYQIAFAHKRIADVAPILIGGLLIGAAGQIAKMLIGDSAQTCSATTSMVMHVLTTHYA